MSSGHYLCIASLLAFAGNAACARPAGQPPAPTAQRPIFVFDANAEPPLVHYSYRSGHFELVYDVFLYEDRTVCYLNDRSPRRAVPHFHAASVELGGLCTVQPERCAWPAELSAQLAIVEALRERANASTKIEVHIYTHPDETSSLAESIALAKARGQTLKPLLAAQGIGPQQVQFYAHGWIGAGHLVSDAPDIADEPCADLWDPWDFASAAEKDAHGRDSDSEGFDLDEVEIGPAFESELRTRCLDAALRCEESRCLKSYGSVGWAQIIGSRDSLDRRELTEAGPAQSQWISYLRAEIAELSERREHGAHGMHTMNVAFTAGQRETGYSFYPGQRPPPRLGKLDTFFSEVVAHGCRFKDSPTETVPADDPRRALR